MPGFDGTGPRGMGSMTGGGFGYCTGFAPARRPFGGAFGRGFRCGMGYGHGRGFGRGYRAWRGPVGSGAVPAAPRWTPSDEAAALREEIRFHQQMLEEIQAHLAELEKTAE